MATFIISNRPVVGKAGQEQFVEKGNAKASHDFRVAEYNSKDASYRIIGDLDETGYANAAKKAPSKLSGSAYLFSKLFKANGTSKAGDILVFIHGFNYSVEDNLKHIAELERLYLGKESKINHLVYISWPSRGKLFKYKDDQLDARETGRVLARLFEKLRRFLIDTFEDTDTDPCKNLIHLAAHSMGNQVLYFMLKQLDPTQKMPVFSEVLLLNADAPADGFEPGQPFCVLEEIAERTHIYIHKSDDALWISDNLKGNSKRLGRRGPTDPMSLPPNTFVVDCSGVSDVAEPKFIKERAVDHWGYLFRPSVMADVQVVFSGLDEEEIIHRTPMQQYQYFRL